LILLIDNYDSFTWNLVQRLGEIDPTVDLRVVRNDKITIEQIEADLPERYRVRCWNGSQGDFPSWVYALATSALGRCLAVR
jgi:hypothetical protein